MVVSSSLYPLPLRSVHQRCPERLLTNASCGRCGLWLRVWKAGGSAGAGRIMLEL